MSSLPRKRPASDVLVAGGTVVVLIALVAAVFLSGAGSSLFPPDAATTQARDVKTLYDIVFGLAVAIFVVVEALIVWSILRYRRRAGDDELPPQTHGNNLVEVIWTLIPTAIVLFLFVISYQTLNTVDAVSADPQVRIHAIAGQFQWQFEYLDASGKKLATQTTPQYDASTSPDGGMAIPVGRSIQVTLDSPDVIHAFYVPRFLFKRDVVPGQTNKFEFTVDPSEAGQDFRGQCAELCGTGHRVMLFTVRAMTQGDYDAWLAKLVEAANATPAPAPSGAATFKITAKDIAYDNKAIEVAANTPFVIDFTNADPAGVAHDVDIRQADGKTVVIDQKTTDGGQTSQYQYKGLPPGTYTFICSIHPIPAMTGTLTVK
jgi:cytochrome c oxidase subunit 2